MSVARTPSTTLDRAFAQRILQSVGESGTPPERGVRHVNVGNEGYLDVLRAEYLESLLPAGGSTFKLVQAYFGGGKTHFLLCLRELAWDAGFVSAYVGLSPNECPFHEPLMVYRAVVRALRAPPGSDAPLTPTTGLPDLVRDLVEDRRVSSGDKGVRAWLLRTVRQLPIENQSLRNALSAYGLALLDDDTRKQDVLAAYLSGDEVPVAAHRELGIFEPISKANAFAMLRGVCQALRGLGFPGTVLLFDELDRNLSIGSTTKSQHRLTDNLRELVDLCGRGALPGVMLAYAVPPEFMGRVVDEYPALKQRLASPLPLSVRSPQSALIDLEHVDLHPKDLLLAMGERLMRVFEVARDAKLDPILQAANLARVAQEAAQSQFEVSHRRVFVKAWVGHLYDQLSNGERAVTQHEVGDRILSGARALLQAPSGAAASTSDGFEEF
jgi:hypothetical protein